MTSISPVATSPAPIPTNTSIAGIAKPKDVASAKHADRPDSGPAATVQLSQQALAMLKGDKDWKPGQTIDSI